MKNFPRLPPYEIPEQDNDLWGVGQVDFDKPTVTDGLGRPAGPRAVYDLLFERQGQWHRVLDIAATIGRMAPNVRKHLNQLEADGWVERRSHPLEYRTWPGGGRRRRVRPYVPSLAQSAPSAPPPPTFTREERQESFVQLTGTMLGFTREQAQACFRLGRVRVHGDTAEKLQNALYEAVCMPSTLTGGELVLLATRPP